EEIHKREQEDLFKIVHPDDRSQIIELLRKIQTGELDKLESYQLRLLSKSNKAIWGELFCSAIEFQGKPAIFVQWIDITERKQNELALRRERDRAQQYLDTAGVIIDALDINGNITMINKKGCEVLGYDNEAELIGKNWIDTFRANDTRKKVRKYYNAVMGGELELIGPYESEIITKNGERRTISWSHSLIKDEVGRITGLLSSGNDITERIEAIKALREERDKAQKYLDIVGMMILVLNKRGAIELLNQAGCQILGYKEEELIGLNWFSKCIPKRFREEVLSVFTQIMNGQLEPVEYYENPILTKNGEERIIAWHNTMLTDDSGRIIGTLSSGEDISERRLTEERLKESEEQYRNLFETMSEGVIFVKPDGQITEANPAACRILGLTFSEIEDRKLITPEWEILRPDGTSMPPEERVLRRAMIENRPVKNVVMGLKHPDSTLLWIDASATPIINKAGELEGIVGIFVEITERKKAEEVLQAQQEFTEQVINALTDTFYIFNPEDGLASRWNTAFEEIGGYNYEEMERNTPLDYYPPEEHERIEKAIRELLEKGQGIVELTFITKDGRKIPYEYSGVRIKSPEGKYWICAIGRDITERKQAEIVLQQNKQRLDLALETAELGIWDRDIRTGKVVRNERAAQIYGYSLEEMEANIHWWEARIHPEDKQNIIELRNKHIQGLTPIYEATYRLRHKSGEWRWVKSQGKVIERDKDGTALRITGTLLDITSQKLQEDEHLKMIQKLQSVNEALKKSEESFKTIFTESPVAIELYDSDGKLIDVNQACLDLFGVVDKGEIYGFDLFKDPNVKEEFKEKLSKGEPIRYQGAFDFEKVKLNSLYRTTKSGIIQLDVLITPLQLKRKELPIHYLVKILDITEQKQLEQALVESEEKFKVLTESTLVGHSLIQEDQIIYANEAYFQIIGFPKEEIINKRVSEFARQIHPDDLDFVSKQVQRNLMGETEGVLPSYQFRWHTKDGHLRWLEIYSRTINLKGKPTILGTYIDITSQKQSEQMLRESEEKFRALAESTLVGLAIIQDNKIKFGNDQYYQIIGHPKDVVTKSPASSFLRFVHPEDSEFVKEQVTLKMKGESSDYIPRYSFRWYTQNNQLKWLEVHSKTISFQGRPAILAAYMDITESKQVENGLKESEEKFRVITESSQVGITIGQCNRLIYINDAFSQLIGYSREEMLSWTDFEFLKAIHPNDSAVVKEQAQKKMSGETQGMVPNYQFRIITKANDIVWVDNYSRTIQYLGKPAVLNMMVDITKRKQIELALQESVENFRVLADSNVIGMAIFQDNQVKYVNDAFAQILEYTTAEIDKWTMKEILEHTHIEDRNLSLTQLKKRMVGDKAILQEYQVRWITQTKKIKWVAIWGGIISYGGKSASLTTAIDITEQKKLEETTMGLLKRLQTANLELEEFASIVSHDLKAPLRNIKTLTEWVLKDAAANLNTQAKDHLVSVSDQINRMDALITGVLDYSRIGRVHEKKEDLDLNDVLSHVINALAPSENIKINIQPDLPSIIANRTHIIQIFSNLIDNAIKFIDKPKGFIYINCEDKMGFWQFGVTDNGPGIEKRHFERIFQAFQTITPQDDPKSTGIGLTIVKKIVELNGGKVRVESIVGKGSTFYFTLPKGLDQN
ncbi:MAG: PAS domain S-box protein, partial [Promethearchaeota archaeon]